MPLYIPRENTSYLRGAVPTLVLVSADSIERLPTFWLDAGRPSPCENWQIFVGLTASVIDGPGDSRIFIEGIVRPEEAEKRFAWLEAVDHAGGVIVLVVDSHDAADDWAALADGRKTRGGFMPAVPRDS
ncbi:hypothetical protein [Streptosporangium saharense]|uniref:hypothetical protein n=1 Tax=Streptosporangium saharense TaxID=1706840 RepID=UPI00331E3582